MLGGIFGFLLCISYILTFYGGIVYSKKKQKIKKIKKIKTIEEEDKEFFEECKRRQRKLDKSFKNLMAYDVKQAMGDGE